MLVDVHTRQLFIQPALEVESLSFNEYNKPNVICKEVGFLNNLKNGRGEKKTGIKFLAYNASKQIFPRLHNIYVFLYLKKVMNW